MRITGFEVRCCRRPAERFNADSLLGIGFTGFDFLVVTLRTDTGASASMFGFAGRSAEGAGRLIADSVRPFLLGRDPLQREALWHDFRKADRWWSHLPIYAWGPIDTCLWLLGAQLAGQPLYQYIGGLRTEVPTCVSSLVLASSEAYAEEALAARAQGYRAYKLHTPGRDLAEDLRAHALVREAVGADERFKLMSDPVSAMNLGEAIRFGRALERLDYYWFEEPLFDEDMHALRELTRTLEIPVVGTEVLAKHPYSVARVIADGVVDRVRADVSWTGGVTGVLKTARLAESFGVNCEVHSSIFHPLELVNLHCCAAIRNTDFFELLAPVEGFEFGLKGKLPIADGIASVPQGPGLGMELDWDEIDACTVAVV
jgi:L-alanine-DL-glutamate epimerase-like enolase superfamily enzyme